MARKLDDVIATLPATRRARIETRFQALKDEIDCLSELRRATGKAQAEIAATLKIKQPSVSKIEKQTDMYLSTLRNYIEAIGGELDLIVRLPERAPLRLERLGDVGGITVEARGTKSARRLRTAPKIARAGRS